jgi:APA family basic amino acid/polyamine antiporter
MAESNNQLVRALGLTDSSALVVGKVIGTGVFLKAAVMTQQVHTPLLMLAAWVAAGLLSLAGTLAYAELAAMFPQAGGEYVYLRAAYGKAPAFLYGWMQIVVGQAGVIAALGIACATFASALVPLNAVWFHHSFHLLGREIAWRFGLQQVGALALILSFAAINCVGVALGGRAQSVLTGAKLLGIGVIVVGAFFFSGSGSWSNLTSAFEGFPLERFRAVWGGDARRVVGLQRLGQPSNGGRRGARSRTQHASRPNRRNVRRDRRLCAG